HKAIESAIQNDISLIAQKFTTNKYILEKDIRPILIGAAARHSSFEVKIPDLGAST
ncbi:Hypothetical protein FKW44_012602, partial [Caligus rogercresseyi]